MPLQNRQVHEKRKCFSFFNKSLLGEPSEVGRRHPDLCKVGLPSALHTRSRTHPPTEPSKTHSPHLSALGCAHPHARAKLSFRF